MSRRFAFLLLLPGILFLAFTSIEQVPTPYQWPETRFFPPMPVAEDNPVSIEGAELGRHLFYDPILSRDSTFSCSSCHFQAYAFSDTPKAFSIGIDGSLMRRNTPALFNLAWYPSLNWDGKHNSIESQVFHPVSAADEMNISWTEVTNRIMNSSFYQPMFKTAFGDQKIDSILISKAVAQFERTLISNNSKYDKIIRGKAYFNSKEYEGFVLMNDQTKGDCLHCHVTDGNALGTNGKFSNNGLEMVTDPQDYTDKGHGEVSGKENEFGLFRIPSLRNIALTAPYMHDGSISNLEEVLNFYSEGVHLSANIDSKMGSAHRGGVKLTEDEKGAIIAFLHTLTDSVFISNPAFSNPFLD